MRPRNLRRPGYRPISVYSSQDQCVCESLWTDPWHAITDCFKGYSREVKRQVNRIEKCECGAWDKS